MAEFLLRYGLVRSDDIQIVADWLRADFLLPTNVVRRLPQVLKQLVTSQAMQGLLIQELSSPSTNWEVRGLGLSCFLPASLCESYLQSPRPFLFIDVLDRYCSDPSTILDRNAIARANSGDGLDLVVQYLQKGWDFTDARWRAVGGIGHQTFIKYHSGYRLRRALQEDWTAHAATYLAGGYRAHTELEVGAADLPANAYRAGTSRTLFLASRDEILSSAPGSTLSHVFNSQTPRCYFTAAEQDLLVRALEGATDQEMARDLALPLTTVKHRWRQIYQRVDSTLPFVVAGTGEDAGQRGPEKRRHVLAYVEAHPQELRPYERPGTRG